MSVHSVPDQVREVNHAPLTRLAICPFPEQGAFLRLLPLEPERRPLWRCTDRHFAEVDAHRQLLAILTAFEALYALKRRRFWAHRAPTCPRSLPLARPYRRATMLCVEMQPRNPEAWQIAPEARTRKPRPSLYDGTTSDVKTRLANLINPEAWYIERDLDTVTDLDHDARSARDAWRSSGETDSKANPSGASEALEYTMKVRDRWDDELRDPEDLDYAGFTDEDLDLAFAIDTLAAIEADFLALQRRIKQLKRDPSLVEDLDATLGYLRAKLRVARNEKEDLIERHPQLVA